MSSILYFFNVNFKLVFYFVQTKDRQHREVCSNPTFCVKYHDIWLKSCEVLFVRIQKIKVWKVRHVNILLQSNAYLFREENYITTGSLSYVIGNNITRFKEHRSLYCHLILRNQGQCKTCYKKSLVNGNTTQCCHLHGLSITSFNRLNGSYNIPSISVSVLVYFWIFYSRYIQSDQS